MGKYKSQILMAKEVLHKMEKCNELQISKRVLKQVFLELLYKDDLITKAIYYEAKNILKTKHASK